jgi:DNA-binding transcriptional ArsR family regulator
VLGALADADCRRILAELDEPGTAPEIAERCDLPRTSAYRKLSTLSEADLLDERIEVREDGHHATRYVRSVSGVFLAYDGEESFSMDVFPDEPRHDGASGESSGYGSDEGTEPDAVDEARVGTGSETDADAREDAESPDERLARYWSRISEEL